MRMMITSCNSCALIRISSRDTGKTMVDASLGEIMTTCEKINWLLSEGEQWLKPEYRYLLFPVVDYFIFLNWLWWIICLILFSVLSIPSFTQKLGLITYKIPIVLLKKNSVITSSLYMHIISLWWNFQLSKVTSMFTFFFLVCDE